VNTKRLRKAIEKDNIKAMALTALAAATDLPEDVAEEIARKVGAAYLATDADDPEPDAEKLRNYLHHVLMAEENQQYYAEHGSPDGL
jgi:hypothetical protein